MEDIKETPNIDQCGNTILHYAIINQSQDTINSLCTSRTIMKKIANHQNNKGQTPLHLACLSENFNIIKILLNVPEIVKEGLYLKNKQYLNPLELMFKINYNKFYLLGIIKIFYIVI